VKLILNSAETKALATVLLHKPSDGCEIEILFGADHKVGIKVLIGDLAAAIALQSPAEEL